MHTRKSTAAAAAGSHAPDRAGKRRPDRSRPSSSTRSPSKIGTSGTPGDRWTLSSEIEAEIAEIAVACGCELIHAEWKGGVLRLVLDRPPAPEVAGVSLGDCEQVAKQTSALLDVLDFGNGHYLLEVSSPGLDRQLYRPSDYQRFLGRLARVTYQQAAAAADPAEPAEAGMPRRRTVVARIAELRPPASGSGAGEVILVDDRSGERLTLKLEDVRMARLEVEL